MGERLTKPPMREHVNMVALACQDWLRVDELPSPPADACMLRSTDQNLARAVEELCRAYPQQMGCDRHPAGRQAMSLEKGE